MADDPVAAIQKKTALLEYLHLIEIFNGETGSINLGQFLISFDRLANLFNWGEDEKLFALQSRMTGSAATFAQKHFKNKLTFEEIIHKLKERYIVKESPAVALQKFLNFRQTPGMSVRDFFDKATELSAHALSIEGCAEDIVKTSQQAMLKTMLLSNLAPEIRKGVVAKDPATTSEILKFALLEEKAWESVKTPSTYLTTLTPPSTSNAEQNNLNMACAATNFNNKQNNEEISQLKEQVELLTAQVASLVSLQSKQNVNKDMCWKCGTQGHYARECNIDMRDNGNRGIYSNRGRNYNNRGNNYNYRNNQRGNFNMSESGYNNRSSGNNYRGSSNSYRGSGGFNNNNRGQFQGRGYNSRDSYQGQNHTGQGGQNQELSRNAGSQQNTNNQALN